MQPWATDRDVANTKTVTDARLRSTVYQYDQLNRLAQVIQPGGLQTDYFYDKQDNPLAIVDAGDKTTSYKFDDLGRVLSATSPDTGITTTRYDWTNNRKTVTYPGNVPVTYSYDALNRLTHIAFQDSLQDTFYTYDEAKGLNGKGRLTTVNDSSGTTSYVYNALGQVEREERTMSGATVFSTLYTYDPTTADLVGVTYPSDLSVSYQRDNNGRISGILADGRLVVRNITYKPFGPVEDYTVGNNILTVNRTYNDRYLVESISAGTLEYAYQYYDNGSVRKITGLPTPATLAVGATETTHVSGTDKIAQSTGHGTWAFGYHGIPGDMSFTYEYNNDSRLRKIKANGNTLLAEYSYDASGRRVKKVLGDGTVTVFHYDLNNNLIAETDAGGLPIRDYIYLGNEPVAMIAHGPQAGTYYFINDHLGTPQQLVNDAGTVVWQAAYLPYGQAQIMIEDVTNNLRFPGQYYDAESGLHQNWHRYYDPETGTYLTPDPIGLAGGVNLYAYVQNNPINRVDPWGLDSLVANQGILTHYDNSGNAVGSYPYTSGRDGVTNPSIPKQGPIPPGTYSLDPKQISEGGFLRNLLGDWGQYRAPLSPDSATNTYGRDGFFLHGGKTPGSAGCIDIGSGDKTLFPKLMDHKGPVPLTVK